MKRTKTCWSQYYSRGSLTHFTKNTYIEKSCTLLVIKILFFQYILSNCTYFHEYSSKLEAYWSTQTPPSTTSDSSTNLYNYSNLT